MKYLLDTCVVSDYIKGQANTRAKLLSCMPSETAISTVTLFEIHYGLERNPAIALKIKPILQSLIEVMTVLPFTEKTALHAGSLRAYLQQQGTPIGSYDILIAATATTENLILVTSNLGEFSRVPTIQLENWR
ncbi:MAG: PIN domain-containing protein [Gammaproteobacteria bacterium]